MWLKAVMYVANTVICVVSKLVYTKSVERAGLESSNASKKHHKCHLQLTDDFETVCHVTCKVHTVMLVCASNHLHIS